MSEQLEIQGVVSVVKDIETFQSGFTKRVFVITSGDENYPQEIPFELFKDKTNLIDNYPVGTQVTVAFNVRGNEYKGKHYVSLNAWRVTSENQAAASAPAQNTPQAAAQQEEDIPF